MLARRRLLAFLAVAAAVTAGSGDALAQHPDGAALVRLLGPRAQKVFAPPGSPGIGALVTLAAGSYNQVVLQVAGSAPTPPVIAQTSPPPPTPTL